jgi:hypothetical protein
MISYELFGNNPKISMVCSVPLYMDFTTIEFCISFLRVTLLIYESRLLTRKEGIPH